MVSVQTPHKAMLHVSPGAYRQWKARHSLMTRLQFERHHGPHAWTRGELCFAEHARAQRVLCLANDMTRGTALAIGGAVVYALATAHTPLGLLPVEVALWTILFSDLLAIHGITFNDWNELPDEEKQSVWDLGCEGAPWSIDEIARRPALLHVPDWVLEAA